VQREVDARPGAIVHRLHVRIGELAGVELDLLRTAFETFRGHTVCDRAELALVLVPATWRCTPCDRIIAPGAVLRCPSCDRPARLDAGDEIILERIEMEVPDV
jgi:hydrogenase nickel incorporation protein HypA/HybF